jgi:hypothetical protein
MVMDDHAAPSTMAYTQTVASIHSRSTKLQKLYGVSDDEVMQLAAVEHGADPNQLDGSAEEAHESGLCPQAYAYGLVGHRLEKRFLTISLSLLPQTLQGIMIRAGIALLPAHVGKANCSAASIESIVPAPLAPGFIRVSRSLT